MRVDAGVKESSKEKLVYICRSCGKMGDEKQAENRCPENGGEMEARKTETGMRDCIKSELERVGEEWKKLYLEGIEDC